MPRFSVTVPDDLNEWLEEKIDDDPNASKSGATREQLQRARELDAVDGDLDELLDARDRARTLDNLDTDLDELLETRERVGELESERDRLRDRLEDREDRIDELEEQLARRSQVEEKVDVLATRVEEQQETANAPFFVRWRNWWRNRGEE